MQSVLAAANGGTSVLSSGIYEFSNFNAQLLGINLGNSPTLTGQGSSKTTVQMTAHTSNKAGSVPTTDWTTNQLYLMSVSGSPKLSGFRLQGTEQGHLYNGLRVGQATNAQVSDVTVAGVPGNKNFPPGETFGINDWRTTGSHYSRVEVDGAGVGGSGFATNSSSDVTVSDAYFHDNKYSAGAAFWQTRNITLTDVTTARNVTGLNFERTSGTVTIVRPTFTDNPGQDIYAASDQTSATINIIDPKFSGPKLRIHVGATYNGGPNAQKESDIHVIVNGVDRTADLVHWMK